MNLRKVIHEVNAWAHYNFDVEKPHLGFAEEAGELTHACLKRDQNIRDMGDPAKFRAAILDALGDGMVFLCHWCGYRDVVLQDIPKLGYKAFSEEAEERALASLLRVGADMIDASQVVQPSRGELNNLAAEAYRALWYFAILHGIDLIEEAFLPTWTEVRKRDWRKYPVDGLTK